MIFEELNAHIKIMSYKDKFGKTTLKTADEKFMLLAAKGGQPDDL